MATFFLLGEEFFLRGDEPKSGCLWRMIFSEVQKSKGDCDAGWNVDGGRRLPWIECSDSGGRS
jgi:hypothetical protein